MLLCQSTPANKIYSNVKAGLAQACDGTVDDRICGVAITVQQFVQRLNLSNAVH